MKCRIDFVTNSSSASFTIARNKLTEDEIFLIKNHIEIANMLKDQKIYYYTISDMWSITDNGEFIEGYTSMDNFDMTYFLTKILKINHADIDYDYS